MKLINLIFWGDSAVAIDVAKERLQILTTDCRIPRQRVSYVKNKAKIPAQSAGRSDSFVYQYGTPKHAWLHLTDLYHILPCLGISRI